jgi:hypothetical protein
MKETEFKVLMHLGHYVNPYLLKKGIYISNKPFIYEMEETIETLIERGKVMKDITGKTFVYEKYFENLKQCELVKIKIIEA